MSRFHSPRRKLLSVNVNFVYEREFDNSARTRRATICGNVSEFTVYPRNSMCIYISLTLAARNIIATTTTFRLLCYIIQYTIYMHYTHWICSFQYSIVLWLAIVIVRIISSRLTDLRSTVFLPEFTIAEYELISSHVGIRYRAETLGNMYQNHNGTRSNVLSCYICKRRGSLYADMNFGFSRREQGNVRRDVMLF